MISANQLLLEIKEILDDFTGEPFSSHPRLFEHAKVRMMKDVKLGKEGKRLLGGFKRRRR